MSISLLTTLPIFDFFANVNSRIAKFLYDCPWREAVTAIHTRPGAFNLSAEIVGGHRAPTQATSGRIIKATDEGVTNPKCTCISRSGPYPGITDHQGARFQQTILSPHSDQRNVPDSFQIKEPINEIVHSAAVTAGFSFTSSAQVHEHLLTQAGEIPYTAVGSFVSVAEYKDAKPDSSSGQAELSRTIATVGVMPEDVLNDAYVQFVTCHAGLNPAADNHF